MERDFLDQQVVAWTAGYIGFVVLTVPKHDISCPAAVSTTISFSRSKVGWVPMQLLSPNYLH